MIFTIVKIRGGLKIYNNTERNLRKSLRTPFEVIEIVRTLEIAEQRLKELKSSGAYKKPKKKRRKRPYRPRFAQLMREKMTGSGNIMYGKKHTEETRRKISEKGLGNQRRRGKKQSQKSKDNYKKKRKKWVTVAKGSTVWHCPITGKNVRAVECPPGFVRGYSEDVAEMLRWKFNNMKLQKKLQGK